MERAEYESMMATYVATAEEAISRYLPDAAGHNHTVLEAMRYSVKAGGKRLRPVLMLASYRMCGGHDGIVEPFLAAIEMIHTYSLIHDDLPEMDNDALRRGLPTTHVKYGQAMAVLAGDGLLNYAYETMHRAFAIAEQEEDCHHRVGAVISAMTILARKAGVHGMVGGQCLDVEAEKKDMELSQEQLLYVYENKTAALLQAALMAGAALSGAGAWGAGGEQAKGQGGAEDVLAVLERAGYDLGIAFQLQDDILDLTSTEDVLGKPIGSDARNGKKTYVSYLGLEAAQAEQARLTDEAASLIAGIEVGARGAQARDFLVALVRHLARREK